MDLGTCQSCGSEDYVDENNLCSNCSQQNNANPLGDRIQGTCQNCGTETYLNENNLCDTCSQQQTSAEIIEELIKPILVFAYAINENSPQKVAASCLIPHSPS